MRVSQIMSSPVVTLDKDQPLANAIDLMRRNEISRLVALEAGKIVGMITEKDIAREMGSSTAYRLPPGRMHVSNVMTPNPITVAPEVIVKRAAEIMLDHDISGLPVVEGEHLAGIVTKLDFAKVCAEYDDVYVGQVMEASPTTVSPGDRVVHARRVLLDEDLVGLPVMEGGKLVGVVTVRDVAMKLAAFQEVAPNQHKSERIRNLLVGDIMSQPATTTRTDAMLPEVSRLMLERRFSTLPVLNLEGELVGLLTKTELTRIARERL
ncbi:MAG: CBS domain-containing protein [Candidatus Hadarchaeaceae archaeon]|nr:CBS domain-containing protein [Hadesarchaea archaeon]